MISGSHQTKSSMHYVYNFYYPLFTSYSQQIIFNAVYRLSFGS